MSNDQILTIERSFAASPEAVFDAWTDPAILSQWWGPEGVSVPDLALDVKEGGAWTATMYSDQMGNKIVSGEYKAIERPIRLVFTWAWSDEDGTRGHETEVEVLFEKIDTGTKMTLNQQLFQDRSGRDSHNSGWVSSFTCLEKVLS
ncbi:MAG: SRPBCC domain-containing protein [Rhizobiaceae bacterium]|nr:SRPBCC domain-containing protein [Rhizobiaceae bacterium]MBL4695497.1 SRPBCC domain-containing protein [Rhizobiaceae bacterium]